MGMADLGRRYDIGKVIQVGAAVKPACDLLCRRRAGNALHRRVPGASARQV
jgi:hypothetical protein